MSCKSLSKGRGLQAHPKMVKYGRSDLPLRGSIPLNRFSQGLEL